MKKYYISCTGNTSIASYSKNFYELVLKEKGYVFIDSARHHVDILSTIASRDLVHIEIDSDQQKAVQLLFLMLKTKYKHVSVTLHDAPAVKLPFTKYKNLVLNGISRLFKQSAGQAGSPENYISRIETIYVLSRKHIEPVKKKYHTDNVCYLPYVINQQEIESRSFDSNNLVYWSQDGKEKEIAYYQRLHRQLMEHDANVNLYLTGQSDRAKKYGKNTSFTEDTDKNFFPEVDASATFVLKPAGTQYRNVTSSDPISEGRKGLYLSGSLQEDTEMIRKIVSNTSLLDQIRKDTYNYLMENHSADAVRKLYKD
jgi:hypothetical protein